MSKTNSLSSVIHEVIYCSIREKYKSNHISLSKLMYLTKNIVRIPKSMDKILLKEMESHGFIKRINHQSYFICRDTKQCNKAIKNIMKYKKFAFW